uniref:Tripartite motif containing 14 n=1 Tax=Otus sunia TaxID=257818 RepID=A0A8C8AYJ4_9STRI
MVLCLKDLEEREEQEAGNRRSVEQAANDLKVKCGLLLHWMAHAIMSKRQMSYKVTELQLLLQKEENLAKIFIDEKTQQALEAHDQQLESCQEKQIQQHSDPIQLLKKYMEIKNEMQEPRHLLEQWHPIPLSSEHILNYYKHLVTVLQFILQKPPEARLKESARSPNWEYDSLHPRLKLSDDHLVVSCNCKRIFYPCGPQRFNKLWQVLSRDAFLSGSHYWEVDLLHAGAGWWIGAAYPSIGRKGDSETCRLGWNRASWCLKKFNFEYWAFHKADRNPILIEDDPDCTGIFLDYEVGILSFYNVTDGMAHLHTFCCKFTEPVTQP